MKISADELRKLTHDAEHAFWQVIVQRFPQATTGELSIDRTCRLTVAAMNAIEEWVDNNVPSATK
jgi:hypothetical protein